MDFDDQREKAFQDAVDAIWENTDALRNTKEFRRARRKAERMPELSGLEIFLAAGVLGGIVYGAFAFLVMNLIFG